jgi:SAM-dependent methyltransferase
MRSIEEEARVHRVTGPGLDAFLDDAAVTEALEGPLLAELLTWAKDGTRRALVVGLEDHGRIALELLKAKVFVTVVEPDARRIALLQAAADQAKCGIALNAYASDYMKREFASGGFDLAIFFSAMGRYSEPVVILKKAARELRAGGRIFVRMRVRPPTGAMSRALLRIPGVAKVYPKASELAVRLPGVATLLALPDADVLIEEAGEVFKVERTERYHVLAPIVAWLAAVKGGALGRAAARALPLALKADAAILRSGAMRPLASYLVFYGAKELQLGKTFRL